MQREFYIPDIPDGYRITSISFTPPHPFWKWIHSLEKSKPSTHEKNTESQPFLPP
jgi:hypothetical protein